MHRVRGVYGTQEGDEVMAFIVRTPTVEEQFERIINLSWVGQCPPDEPGAPTINDWVYTVARACAKRPWGIRAAVMDQLIGLTRQAMTRPEKGDEVRRAFQRAYGQAYTPGGAPATPRVEFGDYDPDLLAEYAMDGPEVTLEQLARVSPVSVDISPTDYFHAVFPGEKVFSTTRFMAKGGFVYESPDEAEELRRYLDGNEQGAWYLANPIDGEWRGEGDAYSCRSEANLTSFRHIVLESDVAPVDQWLAMLVQQPLAIVALYRSGGRSVHALVRINARNKSEFDRERDRLRVTYVPLGADPAAMSAVRLTRVPNVIRADNFAYQKLLYLNPKPIARAIYQKETP